MTCKHENFAADVGVNRLTDQDGTVRRYQADVTIKCQDCGQPFEFVGMPGGLSFSEPSCGWTRDGQPEARLPIRPAPNAESN